MFAKWMQIESVIYVCHYIFLHLPDDLTETNGCSQGQSSADQSLLCRSNVPHLTPCCYSWGWLCSTHLLPPDASWSGSFSSGWPSKVLYLKIAPLTLPWAFTEFSSGISEFQGKVHVPAGLVSYPDSACFPKVWIIVVPVPVQNLMECEADLSHLAFPIKAHDCVMVWLLWLLTTLRQDC